MPSAYIQATELTNYGLPSNTTTAQINQASALVDAFLKRPEGLQWMPDYNGDPCYMAGLNPRLTKTSAQPIAPGKNVLVPFTSSRGVMAPISFASDVVILDRATGGTENNVVEACVIQSVQSNGITLWEVKQNHAANATIDFGLTIQVQKRLPTKRSLTVMSSWPVVRLISGAGSYRYGRRNEQQAGLYADQSVLAMMQTFGGPPEWIPFDVNMTDINALTGEIWIPSGVYLAYYSDVRLWYVAGYGANEIPEVVKQATAAAINGIVNSADLVGGLKMAKAADHQLERFTNSVLDDDMRLQLGLYRARMII